ncbi:luciferase-like monooxygenase family protein [Paraburkholderia xenovorans LB400]|uniref:Uncharacterized protein n=1 Tax=Paraburkholderia xenovorans (strain LB400) TaxID=266265 RepID=Q13IN4_PARXL|nr:hypothetical protein Bxe_C0130 [Paraburkholderia xenovorans LB400]AIP34121.1 luciferase-like monooxygenase family protein [Paraburkholderia xenovorans LB400]
MSESKRQIRPGAFLMETGHHIAAWRHPDMHASGGPDFQHYVQLARIAERAKFDVIFFANSVSVREKEEGTDGFNVMPPWLPGGLSAFTEQIVPELQRRGLFRTEYEGRTLRENPGLPRPVNRHVLAGKNAAAVAAR